jgi:hypothetical protein
VEDQPREYEMTTLLFLPCDNSHRHCEDHTTRGGARFQWPFVATSLHAVDPQQVDPNHDADIRIDSEAPKQRCPFLYPAWEATLMREQTATSDRSWQIVADKRRRPKVIIVCFSC